MVSCTILLGIITFIVADDYSTHAAGDSPCNSSGFAATFSRKGASNDRKKKKKKNPKPPLSFSDEIGLSPALRYEYFDPLGFARDDLWPYYREAELKHGRIAMLATVGMGIPDIFGDKFHFLKGVILSPSNVEPHPLTFGDIPCGVHAIHVVPWQGWMQILLFCGFLECNVFVQIDPKDMPGDYGVGYLGLRDKGRHERSLLVELEHGRLAMIAFVGQVAAEMATGQTVGDQWRIIFGDGGTI